MKSKNNYNLYITFLLLSFVASCTKSLEIEPKSVITNESFWKSENDAVGVLNGMYSYFRNMNKMTFQLGECRSEIPTYGIAGTGGYDLFYENTLNPNNLGAVGNYSSGVDWSGYYKIINSANLIIKYVPPIEFSSEERKNRILAEAYAMRAFVYFTMVKTWGDVVVRTEPTEGFSSEITFRERTSKEAVFELIKSDINQSINLFPNNNIPLGRHSWSKPSVNALKADVYLWTGKLLNGGESDFQEVIEACNAITSSNVELLPEFSNIFEYENKGNSELLMVIYFDLNEEIPVYSYFRDLFMFRGLMPAGASEEALELVGTNTGGGHSLWRLSDLVRDKFSREDKRRDGTFFDLYDYKENGDSVLFTTVCLKGTGAINSGGVREYVSDIIIYRYAEVLLMKAEAKNALGMDPSEELNLIRKRAFGDNFEKHQFNNGSKEENDRAILQERLFELVYEGKRWWDLRRFEKIFDLVPSLQDRKGEDYLNLFPVSTNILSLEPLIEQNPGY